MVELKNSHINYTTIPLFKCYLCVGFMIINFPNFDDL